MNTSTVKDREGSYVVNRDRDTQLRGERADWREDGEYETENVRQELSTRAARVYRYTNSAIKVAS